MTVDYIILALLISFFINGWMKGFFRSLIGPICFIFFGLVAVINFDLNQNLIKSLVILSLGTLISTIVAWLIWLYSRRTVPMEERYYIFIGSRFLGGIVTLLWRGLVLSLLILLATILPNTILGAKIKETIKESKSYAAVDIYLLPQFPYVDKVLKFVGTFASPSWSDPIKDSKRFQDFIQNDKVQSMLNDPETMKAVNNKDFIKLLSDRKVINVINDEALMREFTYLAEAAMEASRTAGPSSEVQPAEKP